MSQGHSIARSNRREELPLELRVYGLEGITQTQDEALAAHAVTLAEHDTRIRATEVLAAVHTESQATMQKSLDAVVTELVKTRWTLIGFAVSVAVAAVGAAIGIG